MDSQHSPSKLNHKQMVLHNWFKTYSISYLYAYRCNHQVQTYLYLASHITNRKQIYRYLPVVYFIGKSPCCFCMAYDKFLFVSLMSTMELLYFLVFVKYGTDCSLDSSKVCGSFMIISAFILNLIQIELKLNFKK